MRTFILRFSFSLEHLSPLGFVTPFPPLLPSLLVVGVGGERIDRCTYNVVTCVLQKISAPINEMRFHFQENDCQPNRPASLLLLTYISNLTKKWSLRRREREGEGGGTARIRNGLVGYVFDQLLQIFFPPFPPRLPSS